jgi:uncharacterized protein YdaT
MSILEQLEDAIVILDQVNDPAYNALRHALDVAATTAAGMKTMGLPCPGCGYIVAAKKAVDIGEAITDRIPKWEGLVPMAARKVTEKRGRARDATSQKIIRQIESVDRRIGQVGSAVEKAQNVLQTVEQYKRAFRPRTGESKADAAKRMAKRVAELLESGKLREG